jgi:hypothetical protein
LQGLIAHIEGTRQQNTHRLEGAAWLALEVLEKHRQVHHSYPVGLLGHRAAESLKEALGEALEENVGRDASENPNSGKVAYGCVTTHSVTGQQFFYRWPEPPYLDNTKECVIVYTIEP